MKKLILLLIFMQLGVVSMAQDLYKNMNAPYMKEYRIFCPN